MMSWDMKSLFSSGQRPLNILLVGNNPIEMSTVVEKLRQVRKHRIVTEIAFDIKSTLERLMHFKPNFILIDDNLGRRGLKETIQALTAERKTRDIPITVLKNSNYREIAPSSGILDYLLKQNISADSLYGSIRNALRMKRTQALLMRAYRRNSGWLRKSAQKVRSGQTA